MVWGAEPRVKGWAPLQRLYVGWLGGVRSILKAEICCLNGSQEDHSKEHSRQKGKALQRL